MARTITPKQKKFAKAYIETGNATQSALIAYDTTSLDVAKNIGSENLTKPNVQEYIQSKAEVAAEIVFTIAQHGESDDVRLKASKDILDRAGYKAVDKSVVMNVAIEASDRIKELAKKLNK